METGNTEAALRARERGNDLYKKGHFHEATKAYDKAVSLAPGDPTPLSNLSAVNFEAGKYAQCVEFAAKALSLLKLDPETDALRQRLLIRQAKAYLHLSNLNEAEKLLGNIKPGKDLKGIHGLLKGLKKFGGFSSQPKVLREMLLQLPRIRPQLVNEPEYYGVGHDDVESLYTTALRDSTAKDPVLSMMFCGIGDARNLFQTLIQYNSYKGPQKLHITIVDIKPAVIARDLIIFHLMNEAVVDVESKDIIRLSLTYIYFTQVIPPFAWEKLQETISKLLGSLEKEKQPFSFARIPVSQMDDIVWVLKSWQRGPATEYKTSRIRSTIAKELANERAILGALHRKFPECKPDHDVFVEFNVMFPPPDVLSTFEPELSTLAADFRSGSKGAHKRIHNYLDKHWKVNVTFVDAAWQATRGPDELPHFGQDPFQTIADLNFELPGPTAVERKSAYCIMKYAVKFFARASLSILILQKRLMIEVIVGDMIDILERLRYGHLDEYRQAGAQESSLTNVEWPQKYHIIHGSNVPDYLGGSLANFLYAGPVLKEGDGTGVASNVLRNTSQFENLDRFNAEHLIMHDRAAIEKHFLMKLGGGGPPLHAILSMQAMTDIPPTMLAWYYRWESCHSRVSPLEQLMPQASLSKWLFAHFLKICLPFPRPTYDISQVYAPNNMTAFMRLLVQMAEVGYPGHWLSSIITSLSSGSITTAARAPRKYVLDKAAVDAVYPSRTMSVKPWSAEFTTLATMWRSVLPFTVVVPDGTLPPPEIIAEYSIFNPLLACSNTNVSHFAVVFWNAGKYGDPPKVLRSFLLDDEKGDTTASAQKMRSDGIVILSTFRWNVNNFLATFWLRSDVVSAMLKEDWIVCIWRIDDWTRVTPGLPLQVALQRERTWKECVTSSS